jgi:hypothetical protein
MLGDEPILIEVRGYRDFFYFNISFKVINYEFHEFLKDEGLKLKREMSDKLKM